MLKYKNRSMAGQRLAVKDHETPEYFLTFIVFPVHVFVLCTGLLCFAREKTVTAPIIICPCCCHSNPKNISNAWSY